MYIYIYFSVSLDILEIMNSYHQLQFISITTKFILVFHFPFLYLSFQTVRNLQYISPTCNIFTYFSVPFMQPISHPPGPPLIPAPASLMGFGLWRKQSGWEEGQLFLHILLILFHALILLVCLTSQCDGVSGIFHILV